MQGFTQTRGPKVIGRSHARDDAALVLTELAQSSLRRSNPEWQIS